MSSLTPEEREALRDALIETTDGYHRSLRTVDDEEPLTAAVERILADRAAAQQAQDTTGLSERVAWAERFLTEWARPYFGDDVNDAVACVVRAMDYADAALLAPADAPRDCGDCPGCQHSGPCSGQRVTGIELHCDDCQQPYECWYADSGVWNLVIGGPAAKDDPGGMLCPRCFTIRAETVYKLPIWHLRLDRVNREPVAPVAESDSEGKHKFTFDVIGFCCSGCEWKEHVGAPAEEALEKWLEEHGASARQSARIRAAFAREGVIA